MMRPPAVPLLPDTAAGLPVNGLFGSGCVTDAEGAPLRPGGRELTETLLGEAHFRPNGIILDIGCGQGASVGLLLDHDFMAIGVDPDPQALKLARRNAADGAFLNASGAMLPLPDASPDGILAECSLSVMPDRQQALAEWCRVLRPGGILAMSDVYRRDGADPATPAGITSRAGIETALAASGLTPRLFADCSPVLKAWVAQFIFRYGSLEALGGGGCGLARGASLAGLGYCIAIAVKPAAPTGDPDP